MEQSPYERLVVGVNPFASNARFVRREVITPLMAEAKLDVLLDATHDTDEALIDMYRARLRPGDRLLLPGGDGTYHRSINALRFLDDEVRESVQLGFLAYGNRCDTARVAGRYRRDVLAMADTDRALSTYHPLRVVTESVGVENDSIALTNRLALGYTTLGRALAEGAETFNTLPNRYRLNASQAKLATSAGIALKYYFRRVGTFAPLPEGTAVNGQELDGSVTDLIALNGPMMAGVVPNKRESFKGNEFQWGVLSGNSRAGLARLGLRRVLSRDVFPDKAKELTVTFPYQEPAFFQADGEYFSVPVVDRVTIDKADEAFTVVTK